VRTVEHSDGAYAVLSFSAACATTPSALDVRYDLLFDVDPQHHGLAQIAGPAGARSAVLTAGARAQAIDVGGRGAWAAFAAMVKDGMVHIAQGYDHILFLLALILPSVLRREDGTWRPVEGFGPALRDVVRIVTAFTAAHSITLTASALGVMALPSRFVEAAIAASVILAAANNVRSFLGRDRWTAAFALGLLHGFGFSSTLLDLGLPRASLVTSLVGFNLGVEAGQLAIVALFLPVAYALRASRTYRTALVGGSVLIGAVAAIWLVERAFAVRIFPV
jgi:hypothetical protein